MRVFDRIRGRVDLELRRLGVNKRESFGLNGLDHKLNDYIHFRNGVFIEAGGNNGLDQSNSLFFERYLGWTGLLVEPIPHLADLCRNNRPSAKVEQCALVPFEFPDTEIVMHYCNLMSVVDGSFSISDLEKHLSDGRKFLQPGEVTHEVIVPARTLTSIIEQIGFRKIDLLSLDVEGFEISVLRGLDFERHAPTWMLIEGSDHELILKNTGERYEFVASLSGGDKLYRHK